MTFNEFLAKLRLVAAIEPFTRSGPFDRIRTTNNDFCPVEAVHGDAIGPTQIIGEAMGLSSRLTSEIIMAADNISGHEETRNVLLDACGLAE